MTKRFPYSEVQKHNKRDDCWMIIHGKIYDLTSFLDEHPGGEGVLLKQAGKDGTAAFSGFHQLEIIEKYGKEKLCVGEIDTNTIPVSHELKRVPPLPLPDLRNPDYVKPPLEQVISCKEFELIAKEQTNRKIWEYYLSGANGETTRRENYGAFQRIWFRPRVLVNVGKIDISTTIFGCPSSLPAYIASANVNASVMGSMAYEISERVFARAAWNEGIHHHFSMVSALSIEDVMSAKCHKDQFIGFQVYFRNHKQTKDMLERAEKYGCRAVLLTVDAAGLGRRERDIANGFIADASILGATMNWDDVKIFRSYTKLPFIIKGVQCGEDAVLAVKHGAEGIVVSNHGGRQLDYSRSGIETLVEVMSALRKIGAEKKIEVLIDGGITRGTDIFKALALGAKAVGLGRTPLYAMAAYGQEGVEKMVQILKEELIMCMRLMGTPTIKDIQPSHIITKSLTEHVNWVPHDVLAKSTYQPLVVASKL